MRQADHDIDTLFIRRWSARAMSGEKISHGELMKLFEAARWAPSIHVPGEEFQNLSGPEQRIAPSGYIITRH